MNISQLKNITHNIPPKNLECYLRSNGWVPDGDVFGQATIWHRREEGFFDFEVIQPTSINIKGYQQRILDAVNSLSEFENRSPLKIIRAIDNFFSDSVKIRVVHADVEEGTIPIDDGVLLIEKSRDLLAATTLSTFRNKAHFTGQRNTDVQNFIKQLRLGQTEVGSFVVNLIAPIVESFDAQLDQDKISITRAVTNNLSRSLLALENGIKSYQNTESVFELESIVESGVSANLCDALVGLSGTAKTRSFTISIYLAGAEADIQNMPKQFNFCSEQVPTLELASAFYKGNYVIKAYEAFGLVSRMTHLPDDDFGEITVRSLVRGVEKNVVMQLALNDYWDAVHAHERKEFVSCKGALHVTAKSAKMLDSHNFKVVGSHSNSEDECRL
ncbi:hypothetical protein ACGMNB_16870 [Shewanella oncorhynchi]|uniref:hypothetical protein n=1 Tax=Shewanella TaxID=22 RepID=UPI0021DABA4A|nr:hypothetical protein [Shewanella sp. SM29]MCU8073755.1 hypothetical protein [Shewanella sp. SM29]